MSTHIEPPTDPQLAQEWRVSAVFDTHDQAKQAGLMLVSLNPRAYKFEVRASDGEPLWTEEGLYYNAREVSICAMQRLFGV